jgi:hypothetical protein
MTRPVEPDVCGQIKKVGFSRALQKVLTVVVFPFLIVTSADTLSHAQTVSNNPNPLQSYTQGFAASNPSCAYNSQQGNLISVAARVGIANCWGSNGPPPIHVCLTDEMGIGFSSFYGFMASLNFVDRNDYGATIELDVNRFQFHGNGNVTDTVISAQYSLVIGDSLSGDITTTIAALNSDFHLGSSFTHFVTFYPRLQFVDYAQDMSLTNHTRGWSDYGAERFQLLGLGGVLEINKLPFLANQSSNGFLGALSHDLRLSGTIGTGGRGVTYWSWKAALGFVKYRSGALKFGQRYSEIEAQAGASMWQILQPPTDSKWGDMGRVDTLMFFLQLSATF